MRPFRVLVVENFTANVSPAPSLPAGIPSLPRKKSPSPCEAKLRGEEGRVRGSGVSCKEPLTGRAARALPLPLRGRGSRSFPSPRRSRGEGEGEGLRRLLQRAPHRARRARPASPPSGARLKKCSLSPQMRGAGDNYLPRLRSRSGRAPRARISEMYCRIVPSTDSLKRTPPWAISRSAVTPGLLSHLMSGTDRPASCLARSAARITSAKRLGTFSKQSSTVTRANRASKAKCERVILGRKRPKSRPPFPGCPVS